MLDWIFEGIITWFSSIISQIMDAVSGLFLEALGTDMTTMEEYFPFVSKAFDVMQYTAWALLFLITVWQLFRIFGGPITEAESPLPLLLRSVLFALLIGYAKPIFQTVLNIATAPYTALMDLTMTAEDFTFAGVEQTLKNSLTTIISTVSVVGLLLLIILEIALGWNYFKLLLETVERYVVVGVLCYTSPLAYSMGASKATSSVFKSWCRMVGSQLILLVMNVWFLRGFNSSMGQFMGNSGALTSGHGSIFLWLFCALAFLKTAQRFDSYLSSIGLNVAQSGSSLGMEFIIAARAIAGIGGGMRHAGSVFRGGSAAIGAGAAATGFAAGLANKFKGNSYVRDAVVQGGTKMGVGGTLGFVGRAFGQIASRNGATLTGNSISSVASRLPNYSGSIAGEIADRSLGNYIPGLEGKNLLNTRISGGQISTTAMTDNGKKANVELYNADQFEQPNAPHSVVTASDGSSWYQMASGSGANEFYSTPQFSGDISEAEKVAQAFPDAPNSTTLRTVDDGIIEASSVGESSMLYNSAMYNEPQGDFTTITDTDGNQWYQLSENAIANGMVSVPEFNGSTEHYDGTPVFSNMDADISPAENGVVQADTAPGSNTMWYNSAYFEEPDAPHTVMQGADGVSWYAIQPHANVPEFESGADATVYNQAQFQSFMPGYENNVSTIDASERSNGYFEVRHDDGSGTMFYDTAQYATPRGDYQVYEDVNGSQWYAIKGQAAVDRQPIYENGKPLYENGELKTMNVESVRYKATPTRFSEPKSRDKLEIKPPKRKH